VTKSKVHKVKSFSAGRYICYQFKLLAGKSSGSLNIQCKSNFGRLVRGGTAEHIREEG